MTIQNPLGLIAGNGRFPFLLAQSARRKNIKVIASGIRGDTSVFLKPLVDQLLWVKAGELQKLFDFFKSQGVKQVVMAGQVSPRNLFDEELTLDQEFQRIFTALQDRKADTIFSAVAHARAHPFGIGRRAER